MVLGAIPLQSTHFEDKGAPLTLAEANLRVQQLINILPIFLYENIRWEGKKTVTQLKKSIHWKAHALNNEIKIKTNKNDLKTKHSICILFKVREWILKCSYTSRGAFYANFVGQGVESF